MSNEVYGIRFLDTYRGAGTFYTWSGVGEVINRVGAFAEKKESETSGQS